VNHLEIRR